MTDGILKECIDELIENAEEAKKLPPDAVGFKDGKLLAYNEIIAAIQNKLLTVSPDSLDEYGLNFNVDRRFA